MAKLNRGGEPTSGGGNTNYFKPDGKGGRNEVVLLSKLEDVLSSGDFVKLFQNGQFGKPSYPVTMTWLDTGPDDPRHVLCPDEKLQYGAIAWVAYQDGSEWKVGAWNMSKSTHTKLFNADLDAGLTGKVINIQKIDGRWNVTPVSKRTAPAEALELDVPGDDVTERMLGVYKDADAVWEELMKRMEVETREEVIAAFGVGDTDLL